MKILIPLLFLTLGANANEVVYGSSHGVIDGEAFAVGNSTAARIRISETVCVELAAGEAFQVLSVAADVRYSFQGQNGYGSEVGRIFLMVKRDNMPRPLPFLSIAQYENERRVGDKLLDTDIAKTVVGPCSIIAQFVPRDGATGQDISDVSNVQCSYDISYKLTKPSAAGTTTSAPILLPPTQDAAKSWFVKLQVSSDLKAWDDVAPGQFLGSDTAQFFRIQTTEAE